MYTKEQLKALIYLKVIDNITEEITPEDMRIVLDAMVDAMYDRTSTGSGSDFYFGPWKVMAITAGSLAISSDGTKWWMALQSFNTATEPTVNNAYWKKVAESAPASLVATVQELSDKVDYLISLLQTKDIAYKDFTTEGGVTVDYSLSPNQKGPASTTTSITVATKEDGTSTIPDGGDLRILIVNCAGQDITIGGSGNVDLFSGEVLPSIKLPSSGNCLVLVNNVSGVLKWTFASGENTLVPATLSVAQRNGGTVTFDAPAYYNRDAPYTGAVTVDVTGAKAGVPLLFVCTDAATFPNNVNLAGELKAGETNYVHMLYVADSLILAQVHGAVSGGTDPGNPEAVKLATPTLTATPMSRTEIRLSWEDVANEFGTEIQQSANGVSGSTIHTTAAEAVVHTVAGLTLDTDYYFRARRKGDGVNFLYSDWTVWKLARTLLVDPFDIASLGTKLIQYNRDSADAANVTVSGGLASVWKAAIGANFTQGTAANQISHDGAGLHSDGVDDKMTATATVAESAHVFMVLRNDTFSNLTRILNGAGTQEWMLQQGSGTIIQHTYSSSSNQFVGGIAAGQLVLVHAVFNGADSTLQVNDGPIASQTTTQNPGPPLGAINSTSLTLAARSTNTSYSKITPRELVIGRASQLTAQDVTNIRTELKRRYGL